MTQQSLHNYLRIAGWAAIAATFVKFATTIFQRNKSMIDMGLESAARSNLNAVNIVSLSLDLPISLTIACLCLMAARILAFKQQTLQSVFE